MLAGKTASEIFDNIRHLVQSGGLQAGEGLPPGRAAGDIVQRGRWVTSLQRRQCVPRFNGCTVASLTDGQPGGHQPFIGGGDSVAIHCKLAGEFTYRRQNLSGLQPAAVIGQ